MNGQGNFYKPSRDGIGRNRGGMRNGSSSLPHSTNVQPVQDIYIYIPSGAIEDERVRLTTFSKYPARDNVNVNYLAEAGFYFTGKANGRTICYCCGKSVFNWTRNDKPRDQRYHDRNCEMVSNTASDNIPISRLFKITGEFRTTPKQTNLEITLTAVRNEAQKIMLHALNLTIESDRMRSFRNWPSTSPANMPEILARNGFYYLGDFDRVQCYSCQGVMRNWTATDPVAEEHQKYFPNCVLAQSLLPISAVSTANIFEKFMGLKSPHLPDEAMEESLKQLYPCTNSNNPHMSVLSKRLETFDTRWTGTHIVATKEQIAEAGFFFLGDKDRTKCWYCSGGLQNWERNDNPWLEHAKWFPGCEFILRKLGPMFVTSLFDERPNIQRPNISNAVDFRAGIAMLERMKGRESIVDAFLKSGIVEQVKTLGFSEGHIQNSVQRKYQNDGQVFSNFDDLLDYLIANDSKPDEGMDVDETKPLSSVGKQMSIASGIPMTVLTQFSGHAVDVPLAAEDTYGDRMGNIKCVCKLCEKATGQLLCTPCGHVLCESCNATTANCAKCNQEVEERIPIVIS